MQPGRKDIDGKRKKECEDESPLCCRIHSCLSHAYAQHAMYPVVLHMHMCLSLHMGKETNVIKCYK